MKQIANMPLSIFAALIAFMIFPACAEDLSKRSAKQSSEVTSSDAVTDNGEPANDGNKKSDQGDEKPGSETGDSYQPLIGDTVTLATRSKASWTSDDLEPTEFGNDESLQTTKVSGIYPEGSFCRYRVENSSETSQIKTSNESDAGCNAGPSCTEETASACTTEDLEKLSHDSYKDMIGTKTICTMILDLGTAKSTITTIANNWVHKEIRSESRVVKSETLSCTTEFKAGDVADPKKTNVCDEKSRKVTFAKSETLLKKNEKGDSDTANLVAPEAELALSDQIQSPKSDQNPRHSVSCSIPAAVVANQAEKLNIALSTTFCKEKQMITQSVILSADIAVGSEMKVENVMAMDLSNPGQTYMGPCLLNLAGDYDNKTLAGEIVCSEPLKQPMGDGKTKVEKAEFVCALPDGFKDKASESDGSDETDAPNDTDSSDDADGSNGTDTTGGDDNSGGTDSAGGSDTMDGNDDSGLDDGSGGSGDTGNPSGDGDGQWVRGLGACAQVCSDEGGLRSAVDGSGAACGSTATRPQSAVDAGVFVLGMSSGDIATTSDGLYCYPSDGPPKKRLRDLTRACYCKP